MKNALFTDTIRRIKKTRGRFFAIMAIIAIGCGFFAGVKVTSPDMKNTADLYYKDKNLMDIRLVSTFGFSSDEIQAIAEADSEIDGISGGYSADMFIKMDDGTSPITRVYSVNTKAVSENTPDYISHFTLLDGRMPEKPNECLIEADTPGVYKIGDTITLMSGDSETPTEDILSNDTFTITGKVSWVKYVDFERGTTTIGNGSVGSYLVIPDDSFAYEYYTDIYMTLNPAKEMYSFGDEYQDYIDEKCDKLETLCNEIHKNRLDDIRTEISDAEQELADGEKEYQDGLDEFDTKIADAEKEIADSEKEIADAEKEIKDAEKEIADAEKELADGEKELADGEREYNEGLDKFNTEIDKAEKEIADGEREYNEGVDRFNSEISKAENDIQNAQQQISDSERQLSEGQKQYDDGLAAYNEGKSQLEGWKTELAAKQKELEYAASMLPEGAEGMLDSAFAEINAAWQMINASQAELDSSFKELENARLTLEQGWSQFENGKNELENGRRELESKKSEGIKQLEDAKQKLENGKKELEEKKTASLKELEDARKKIEDGKKELEDGRKELEDGKKELEDGKKELADGKKELEDGKKELEEKRADGLKELEDAKAELEYGRTELADAKNDFDELCDNLKWYVFDRNSNTGYSSFGEDADRVDSIARIFPIFFILVAALVCLNTMTRMVEEQRTEIGTLKALGYSNGAIISQFLIYAATASIIGSVAGMLIGFNLFPRVIFQAYTLMYDYPPVICSFRWDYAAGCIAASLLCTCAASAWSCMKELSGQPAQLMRPKPPKNGKRVLLEYIPFIWKRLSFNATVTIRNISRYKSRVLMTVIGIGGCTALMLTGFGLRNAISVIVDLQFGDIIKYDAICAFDTDDDAEKYAELHKDIDSLDEAENVMFSIQKSITVRYSGKIREAYAIVPERPDDIGSFISLRRRLKRNAVHSADDIFTLDSSGVIINEKLAKLLNVSAGDEIGFEDTDKKVTITAVTENYSQNYVYFTPDLYREVFEELEYNIFWINFAGDADEDTVSSKILENSSVLAVNFMSNAGKSFRDLIKSLNAIVYVIIGSSGALAFVVLYNLSNINISERMRELATIKVLGFYDGEVASYIYRENTVSALAGMIAGLFGGIFLCDFVVQTAEVDVVMFYPDIPPLCFLFAAILTLIFTFFVNAMLYFKLKDIDMAGSMKAIE